MPSLTTAQTDKHTIGLSSIKHQVLHTCLELLIENSTASGLLSQLESAIKLDKDDALIAIYHAAIPLFEQYLWSGDTNPEQLGLYQDLFHELETLLKYQTSDNRHHITIVIPVADRPRQLTDCINSLLAQCSLYGYGGQTDKRFNKISVIIADDSTDNECIQHNKRLCEKTSNKGLTTAYFGRDEQNHLIASLTEDQQANLINLFGSMEPDPAIHKGPSVMRNLCYLQLDRMYQNAWKEIFYFIDSDQLFTVNPHNTSVQSINYFYYLDRMFTVSNTQLLTGKVVGDPPVSSAVMANTLLSDVISFLHKAQGLSPDSPCQFHQSSTTDAHDAAYHDMADLFGFTPDNESFNYCCPLTGQHTNSDCLTDISMRLNQFFHGEHPTRSTHYHHINPLDSRTPARTVYTGNYAFKSAALPYFIPFSSLRLRMAGPTLGRMIKSVMGDQFISANIPMLHKRTLSDTGKAEYRPGINHTDTLIDLSQEYIRQYFGDVMLFSVEELSTQGFPESTPDTDTVRSIIYAIEESLYEKYKGKQDLILDKLDTLNSLIKQISQSPQTSNIIKNATNELGLFTENINYNFGPDSVGFKSISDKSTKENTLEAIVMAISEYHTDLNNWKDILSAR